MWAIKRFGKVRWKKVRSFCGYVVEEKRSSSSPPAAHSLWTGMLRSFIMGANSSLVWKVEGYVSLLWIVSDRSMPYSLASNFLGSSCAFYSTPLILFVNNYGPLFIHFLLLSLVILLFCNKIAFMIGFFLQLNIFFKVYFKLFLFFLQKIIELNLIYVFFFMIQGRGKLKYLYISLYSIFSCTKNYIEFDLY